MPVDLLGSLLVDLVWLIGNEDMRENVQESPAILFSILFDTERHQH